MKKLGPVEMECIHPRFSGLNIMCVREFLIWLLGLTPFYGGQIEFNSPSEYLTSVTGSYEISDPDLIFTSIAFGTNKAKYGPFGRANFGEDQKSPLRFDWDWGPHNDFCGFYGKYHGSSLQAIGVYIKPTLSLGEETPEFFTF